MYQNNQSNNSMYRIPNRIFVGGIPQVVSFELKNKQSLNFFIILKLNCRHRKKS